MNAIPSIISQETTQSLPIGTQLEEFIIERVLGSGGFGITYLARDKRLGRQVVVKENLPAQFCWRDTHALTVHPRQTNGEDLENYRYSLDSFEREASTLASLDHPSIVRVLRSFEAYGTAYFVMPFVEGTALDEQIRARQESDQDFTEDELGGMLWRVMDALSYLHERGIYHRDIKPGNILVTAAGEPVLIDFGAARQRLSERSLTVIESAGYTPFEQLQSHGKIGPWSDLYALGGTLYKAITGETPAKAADRILEDPVVPLAERPDCRARYSSRLLKSIDRAMGPKAADRFQDAGQWRDWVWKATSHATAEPVRVEPVAAETADFPPESAPVKPRQPQRTEPVAPSRFSVHDQKQTQPPPLSSPRGKKSSRASYIVAFVLLGPVFGSIAYLFMPTVRAPEGWDPRTASQEEVERYADVGAKEGATSTPQQESSSRENAEQVMSDIFRKTTRAHPFYNNLGMKFVPAGTPGVLFSVWETRVRDFETYVQEIGNDTASDNNFSAAAFTLEKTKDGKGVDWGQSGGSWKDPHFPNSQTGDYPVVCVSYFNAEGFCIWLTRKERAAGNIPITATYRLPSDVEWSLACGSSQFPWGNSYPPQADDGNYCGREAMVGVYAGFVTSLAKHGFYDHSARTAEVGSFNANSFNLHDLGGNVGEWCSTWYSASLNDAPTKALLPNLKDDGGGNLYHVVRGGSWLSSEQVNMHSSYRHCEPPNHGYSTIGFRCVLAKHP